MGALALTRRHQVPGRGIMTMDEVPNDRALKVVHLCRYPYKCCAVCERHRSGCWHDLLKRRSW